MKNLIAILDVIMTVQAQAQEKKTLIYDERTNQLVEVAPTVAQTAPAQAQAENGSASASQSAPQAAANQSPIYILNNQRLQGYQGASQAAIQEQPTTVVVEAPIKVSASESVRKQRAETEAATEDGIVQALERARLEDEVRRREKFNSALAPVAAATASATATAVVAAPAAPAPAVVAAAAAESTAVVVVEEAPVRAKRVVIEEPEEKVDVKAEIRAALAEKEALKPVKSPTSYYVSGLVGMGVYPDADYVNSALSTGFTLGMVTADRFVVEGAFAYGEYKIGEDDYFMSVPTVDMAQYDFSAALKYQLFSGKIRPTVGAVASYTHRSYTSDYYSGYYGGNDTETTDGFNAGLTAGVDVALTNNFSIGVDFRYLWSIASRENSNPYNDSWQQSPSAPASFQKIEDMAYYMTSVAAKFTF